MPDRNRGIHAETHEFFTDGCFLCKVGSVSVAPSATPSRAGGQQAADVNAKESRWQRDMAEYKTLRSQGLQPRQIDGSAALASRAADRTEIELGHVFPDKRKRAEAIEGMALAQELRS